MQHRRRSALVCTAFSAAVAVLAAVAPVAKAVPKSYVALGDSYAAGPFIPVQEAPLGCLRSTNNYAKLLTRQFGWSLRDATCSGATTDHMTRAQGVFGGPHPPQFNLLDSETGLVTLQIGGNDIGFGGIAETCLRAAAEGDSCRSKYVDASTGADELRRRIAETAPKIAAVIDGIRERSPDAAVYLLGYPGIFRIGAGVPASCPAMAVTEDDAQYLRGIHEELNGMIAAVAASSAVDYVDVYAPSAGRTACDLPAVRWIEPIVPVHAAAPVHPNLNGMLGMTDEVARAVKRSAARDSDLELPPGTPELPPVASPF